MYTESLKKFGKKVFFFFFLILTYTTFKVDWNICGKASEVQHIIEQTTSIYYSD